MSGKRLLRAGVFISVIGIWFTRVYAAEPVIIDQRIFTGNYIGTQVAYLEDKGKKLTIADVRGPQFDGSFIPADKEVFGFGYTASAFWVRFSVHNPTDKSIEWFLECANPYMYHLDLYVVEQDGTITSVKTGYYREPAYRRPVKSVNFIFPRTERPGIRTCYLRMLTNGPMIISLKTWSKGPIESSLSEFTIMASVYYSIMLTMLFYNFFIFLFVKERIYFYYIVTIISYGLMYLIVDGIGFNYIWEHSRFVERHSTVVMLPLTTISVVLFLRSFLDTRILTRRLDRMLLTIGVCSCVSLVSGFILPIALSTMVSYLLGVLLVATIVFVVLPVHIYLKSRHAVFFMVAYFLYIAGFITRWLLDFGMIPQTTMTIWSTQIGIACMMILFSLSLADKINVMKNMLADLNINLEMKVEERTTELHAAMEELEAMNENLQATMDELSATNDQLVEARDALWGEMQLAKKIQTVLLPRNPQIPGYSIAACMEPADEVGGDYYDIISVQGRDWIVIGDVSGHGVPAGLVMMMVQVSIQTVLAQNGFLQPAELLNIINKTIWKNIQLLGENKYMTITVFAYIEEGIFHYSGLHQDLLVYRKHSGAVECIQTCGMWIGILDDIKPMLANDELRLERGDTLLLYTDGITESRLKATDGMYSPERLVEVFGKNGHKPAAIIMKEILDSLDGYDRSDDVTMVIIKRD